MTIINNQFKLTSAFARSRKLTCLSTAPFAQRFLAVQNDLTFPQAGPPPRELIPP